MPRPLEAQFEGKKVTAIRKLESSYAKLPFRGGAARYYSQEVARSLDSGLLLAALTVASSMLELFVRDLLIATRFHDNSPDDDMAACRMLDDIERALDERINELDFQAMVEELADRDQIDLLDAERITDFSRSVRVPLHRGMTRSILVNSGNSPVGTEDPLACLFFGRIGRFHRFEEIVEEEALRYLKTIVAFVAKYAECSEWASCSDDSAE